MNDKSETIAKLAVALIAAQSELKTANKDGKNPHYKSHYATVESVLDTCLPVLNKHGIALIQRPCVSADGVEIETIFVHSSGEWISGRLNIPLSKNDAHGVGSAITYLRRYSLAAMAGLKQGDDDGNAAVEAAQPTSEDKLAKLPAEIKAGFAAMKKQDVFQSLDSKAYREAVAKICEANHFDPEAIKAYLRDKWVAI